MIPDTPQSGIYSWRIKTPTASICSHNRQRSCPSVTPVDLRTIFLTCGCKNWLTKQLSILQCGAKITATTGTVIFRNHLRSLANACDDIFLISRITLTPASYGNTVRRTNLVSVIHAEIQIPPALLTISQAASSTYIRISLRIISNEWYRFNNTPWGLPVFHSRSKTDLACFFSRVQPWNIPGPSYPNCRRILHFIRKNCMNQSSLKKTKAQEDQPYYPCRRKNQGKISLAFFHTPSF